MHTTAHPDDEHGGLLAWLSRGTGARVSLMTLNRGQSGDNALGPQLFDGLGLIRTEELLRADQYYGVDAQYFTSVIDYGFSKRLDEALDKWGRENVLRDVVRIIRTERPLMLISRFQGNQRDGHGNHQTAGLVTVEAFRAAGDPNRFPEQIKEGLRAWQPRKVYIGGLRDDEEWTVRVDPGQYSPWLGMSYSDFARIGLSFQRSQNSGRLSLAPGPQNGYYKRADTVLEDAPPKESGFFDGIDTSITGLFTALGEAAPEAAATRLQPIADAVEEAIATFSVQDPSAAVPALARGLTATVTATDWLSTDRDAVFYLERKRREFVDAINTAMGVVLTATAQPAGIPEPTGPGAAFAPPAVMGDVVPGQTFDVHMTFVSRGTPQVLVDTTGFNMDRGFNFAPAPGFPRARPANEPLTRRYTVDRRAGCTTHVEAVLRARVVSGCALSDSGSRRSSGSRQPIRPSERRSSTRSKASGSARRRSFGAARRSCRTATSCASCGSSRRSRWRRPGDRRGTGEGADEAVQRHVEVLNNKDTGSKGEVMLRVPQGWAVEPARVPFTFARGGERATYTFAVTIPSLADRTYQVQAVAMADGREYLEGYETIEYRDLEARQLYRTAVTDVRGIDVETVPGLNIGYVMGIGDQVPDGIRQLGYAVTLLDEGALARGDLSRFDAIVTGTRAYAVREDLKTYNRRLARLRRARRQLDRPLQHAGAGAEPVRAEARRADGACRGSLGGGLTGRHPGSRCADAHLAEQDHESRLRRMGRAARLEVLEHVGSGVSSDHRHLGSRPGAAAGRMALDSPRQGPLHLLCLRHAPAAAVRCRGGIPPDGKPAGPRSGEKIAT